MGKTEGEGPLGASFDVVYDDEYISAKSWEQAENNILRHTVTGVFTPRGGLRSVIVARYGKTK